jgi:hypothetical protein
MLQCLSNAFTRASSFLLFRHEIKTCVCERTAVCRIESGPDVNSCSSSCAISNSLWVVSSELEDKGRGMHVRKVTAWLGQQFSGGVLASVHGGNGSSVLNFCVRHDVSVLDVGTTFLLPRESLSLKEIARRLK